MSRSSTPEGPPKGGDEPVSRESRLRGQTEPLAALVAVAAIALAIGVYAFVVADALDDESERTVGDQAIDLIYDDVEDHAAYSVETSLQDDIEQSSLPEGYNVYVNISQLDDDGERVEIDEARFAADGESAVEDPPDGASVSTRPISIRHEPGDISQGTLRVEVWEP